MQILNKDIFDPYLWWGEHTPCRLSETMTAQNVGHTNQSFKKTLLNSLRVHYYEKHADAPVLYRAC